MFIFVLFNSYFHKNKLIIFKQLFQTFYEIDVYVCKSESDTSTIDNHEYKNFLNLTIGLKWTVFITS